MTLENIIIAFLISVLLTVIFRFGFKRKGPWGNIWTFFLVIFLAVWASELWILPSGPEWKDYRYISLLVIGLLFGFLLVAAERVPSREENEENKDKPEELKESKKIGKTGAYFWMLLIILLGIILVGTFLV
ncbi:MAG: hypothetical protein ACOC3S_03320 [Bacteroidota bacterium]